MTGKLFIIASNPRHFHPDRKHLASAERIAMLLDGVSPEDFSGTTAIDGVYMRVIRAAQPAGFIDCKHLSARLLFYMILSLAGAGAAARGGCQ